MESAEVLDEKAFRLFQIVHGLGLRQEWNSWTESQKSGWLKLASLVTFTDQSALFDPNHAIAHERGWHKDAKEVLAYLNEKAGRKFRESEPNMKFISARLREHEVCLSGVKTMIARQVALWKGTGMEMYLRPETLFNATKFETYYEARFYPVVREEPTYHPAVILKAVREAIESNPANSDSIKYDPRHTRKDKAELTSLRTREQELVRMVAAGKPRTFTTNTPQNGRRLESAGTAETESATSELNSLAKKVAAEIKSRSGPPSA